MNRKTREENKHDGKRPASYLDKKIEEAITVWASAMRSRGWRGTEFFEGGELASAADAEVGVQHPERSDCVMVIPPEAQWTHPTLASIEFVQDVFKVKEKAKDKDKDAPKEPPKERTMWKCVCTDRKGFTYEGGWFDFRDEALSDCDRAHPSINLVHGLKSELELRVPKHVRERVRTSVLSDIEAVERALSGSPKWLAHLLLSCYPQVGKYEADVSSDPVADWTMPVFVTSRRDDRGRIVRRLARPGGLDWIVAPLKPKGWDKTAVIVAQKGLNAFKRRLRRELARNKKRVEKSKS